MIDLLIRNMSVDLPDEGISILFQRQRTDYTNPTIVRNSFTKTIKLPNTKVNNHIFGELWKLDKYIVNNASNFIPSKREPFMLLKEGNLVEMGYVKLNNIVWSGNSYTYEITLYGELGNLLYGLSYNINEETEEVSPLTLADLNFGFNGFRITKDLVEYAWKRLDNDPSTTGDAYKIFDTINFMVSYDGVPETNNFDPKSMWCSVDRIASVSWRDHFYQAQDFPSEVVEGGKTYRYFSTMISRMDPNDRYGLFDLKKEMTPLEARDLRSYLLRPIVNIKKVFEAIGDYINTKYGYTLDMSDPFFNTFDFKSTWMTLSMLYEINPDVESGTRFTKNQLFSNTSSPASYLISYCKTYGIYLDVDFFEKKLVLTRLPNFFNGEKINELKVDISKNVKITPLSFDKATYTFDYGDGDSEFLKKYKETYGFNYGSKKVNTGYRFDASSAPYIDNNVFKQGLDSLDQSIYYKYPYAVRGSILFDYPGPLMDDANRPTYKLIDVENYMSTNEVDTIEGEMSVGTLYPIYNNVGYSSIQNSGYQWMNVWWSGLRENIWQDGFPKLQCHSDDNKGTDSKDILVKFSGFRQVSYGHITKTTDRTYWNSESYNNGGVDATRVNYLLSDDLSNLKYVLGKNCYYDCPRPSYGFGYSYITLINRLPAFSRASYIYTMDYGYVASFYVASFDEKTISGTSDVSVEKSASKYVTRVSASSGRQYSYFTDYGIDPNHRYLIVSAVKTSNAAGIISGNEYIYPDIIGSTKIDSRNLSTGDRVQLIASIVDTGSTVSHQITSLSTYDAASSYSWDTEYLVAYDLTEMGLKDRFSSIDEALAYFGVTEKTVGYSYELTETLDFGVSREIYVPYCTTRQNIGVYNEYWSKYISDVYSINTRVMECYCYLDNIDEVFREFYYYDNCLWILSKITDWNMETKYCKGTFIKVNNINNYIS